MGGGCNYSWIVQGRFFSGEETIFVLIVLVLTQNNMYFKIHKLYNKKKIILLHDN